MLTIVALSLQGVVVGVGAFGRVYKCWDADACLVMAVKAVEIQKNKCAPPTKP